MRKLLTFASLALLINFSAAAQDFGLSFSYFIPKNGYFSTPISPFSIRGLGVDLNQYFALDVGASLYRMSGLNIKGTELKSKDPFVANFTIFVPVELVFQLGNQNIKFDIKGGGFFFYAFDQRLNYGNIDKAIRNLRQWSVANADLSFKNKPGFGYHVGTELTLSVTSQVAVSIETNYLVGDSSFPLKGSYIGGNETIGVVSESVSYSDAKIDFTGLEFSIGLIFKSGGGPGQKAKKRRRR